MGFRVTNVDNMFSDPNMSVNTMIKFEYLVSRYSDTFVVYSNTMGVRVIIVDHMCLGNNWGTFR